MSQQINLLRRGRAYGQLMFWQALAAVMVVVLLILGFWLHLRQENNLKQARLAQLQTVSAKMRSEVARLSSPDDELTHVLTQINEVRPRYEAIKELAATVRSGPLGADQGYASLLQSLGQVHSSEAWLTSIEIRHKGRPLVLTGVALSDRAASNYAVQVNRQLQGTDWQLQAMELVRQGNPQDAGRARPATVTFKLN